MMDTNLPNTRGAAVALLAMAVAVAGCTVSDTPAPPLSGPSTFALGIRLQALPDSITQDGFSQSSIVIEASGPDGRPVRSLAMRVEMAVDGRPFDYGTLSARTVVTGDDGRARLTYTSPPRPAESTGTGTIITISATPLGSDYAGERARDVQLRLLPPGVILPPNGAPVPAITVSPTPVTAFTPVTFDASGTTDEGVPCGVNCTYSWSFGDGGTATGVTVRHEFRATGTYTVRLSVGDLRGQTVVQTQTVEVAASTPPTAAFVFSPQAPLPGQVIFFNASASQAGPGRTIVSYEWDFGSGRFDQGVIVSKGYNTPGSYQVTLKVTDDAGQVAVISQPVNVTNPEAGTAGVTRPPQD